MSEPPSADEPLDRMDYSHLPIGVYVLAVDGRFRMCNDGVRAILGLEDSGAIDANIRDFFADEKRFDELVDAALLAERASDGFEKSIVHFVVNRRDIFVEDYLKPLRENGTGEVTGYLGCMADITDEHLQALRSEGLQKKVEELTFDIGRVLHANTSTLVMVTQTLEACQAAFAGGVPRDQDSAADSAESDALIGRITAQLAQAIEKLLQAGDSDRRLAALAADHWETLKRGLTMMRNYEELIPVEEMRIPALRKVAHATANICGSIAPGNLPREPVREAQNLANELQTTLCFFDVIATKTVVSQMDYTLRALRDFVTAEVRTHETTQRWLVDHLIREAMKQLSDYAQASNVDIVWQERDSTQEVVGVERDLIRTLSNLMHNAIKYSWRRDQSSSPWVAIRTVSERGRIAIEIESWGVPIMPDEIENGLIFEMGYRGQLSTDRGRLGTGIGLTDAQRAARAHHGDIEISSRPATDTSFDTDHPDYFKRPFLTTVRLALPTAD